jgi:Endosomal/lysosomal potassium channel TMEM175
MPSTRYPRPSERDDFGRVMSFTDAVFAIAMTLLVVEIGVPGTTEGASDDPGALLGAFADKGPLIFAFFLGCYVIGFYWAAHHRFMSWLDAVDRGFVLLTVVYARRRRLFREEPPTDIYRWALGSSLLPVLLFALSIPVAFVAPWPAIAMWLLAVPLQVVWARHRPAATAATSPEVSRRARSSPRPGARPAGRCSAGRGRPGR